MDRLLSDRLHCEAQVTHREGSRAVGPREGTRDMRKLSVAAITLLLLGLMAMPALAQGEGTPVEEVAPIEIEEPLPVVDEPEVEVVVEEEILVDDVTEVRDEVLAVTGFGLFEASLVAGGLLLAGLGALLFARRRLGLGQ